MKKTKIFGALLVTALAFALFSCSNPSDSDGSSNEPKVERTKVEGKIGEYGSPYEVGDIVYRDGSATPYKSDLELEDTQKENAIAIIFYKGNGLNSDNASGDTDTSKTRTLGVGLKSKNHLEWGSADTLYDYRAYGNIADITTIRCDVNGSAGNYTISGDKDGSDNLEQIGEFIDSCNGVYDSIYTIENDTDQEDKYPAFYFAKNYKKTAPKVKGSAYEDGWFFPSIAELYKIYKVKNTVDGAIKLCGGTEFGETYDYSASSQAPEDEEELLPSKKHIYLVNFKTGEITLGDKDFPHTVCAVREF